jgi:hypothetical protein
VNFGLMSGQNMRSSQGQKNPATASKGCWAGFKRCIFPTKNAGDQSNYDGTAESRRKPSPEDAVPKPVSQVQAAATTPLEVPLPQHDKQLGVSAPQDVQLAKESAISDDRHETSVPDTCEVPDTEEVRFDEIDANGIEIDVIPTTQMFGKRWQKPDTSDVTLEPKPSQDGDGAEETRSAAPPPPAQDEEQEAHKDRQPNIKELENLRNMLMSNNVPQPAAISGSNNPSMPKLPLAGLPPLGPHVPTGAGSIPHHHHPQFLPVSKTPALTPMQTPRMYEQEISDPKEDCTHVMGVDGKAVDCAAIEKLVLDNIEAVQDCMLVCHWTSTEVHTHMHMHVCAHTQRQM